MLKLNINKNDYILDKADLVQSIILIAGLTIASVLSIGGITSIVMTKGKNTANCIAKQSNINPNGMSLKKTVAKIIWKMMIIVSLLKMM